MRSPRSIEQACVEDVALRVLAARQTPDHCSIATFRARHLAALAGLFGQVVALCRQAGQVQWGHVAVDGSKVRAHSGRHKA